MAMSEKTAAVPPPTEATLHEAALGHLARYSTTQAGLVRVLDRRVARWAREVNEPDPEVMAQARLMVRAVAARLVASGVVNDAVFAESRVRSLTRAGRSRRAVVAHLAARGVDATVSQAVLPEGVEAEFGAAVVFTRRRRIGAFRRPEAEADLRRELGMLARAGFAQPVADAVLRLDLTEAENWLLRLKQS